MLRGRRVCPLQNVLFALAGEYETYRLVQACRVIRLIPKYLILADKTPECRRRGGDDGTVCRHVLVYFHRSGEPVGLLIGLRTEDE